MRSRGCPRSDHKGHCIAHQGVDLYSISNKKLLKYGDMIKSMSRECYLQDVEFKWSAVEY